MIPMGRVKRLWLAFHRVDFRKQERGLLAEVFALGLDPFDGDLVVFIGRGRRAIKVLFADPSGVWLGKKSFSKEAMKTKFRFLSNPKVQTITSGDLAMLFEGADYEVQKRVSQWPKEY